MMSKDEEKRLRKLTEDSYYLERLTYPDLLLLLKKDKKIRKLICAIMDKESEDEGADDSPDIALESATRQPMVRPPVESRQRSPAVAQEPLRQALAPELTLLQCIKSDVDLAGFWLRDSHDTEGRQLVRLIATAAQWDQVLQLWDRLAERCKVAQRAATAEERQMLAACLDIHNLIWQDRQAVLQSAESGVDYDFRQHERGVAKGDHVSAEWLPGIVNAAGQLQKKPLVRT